MLRATGSKRIRSGLGWGSRQEIISVDFVNEFGRFFRSWNLFSLNKNFTTIRRMSDGFLLRMKHPARLSDRLLSLCAMVFTRKWKNGCDTMASAVNSLLIAPGLESPLSDFLGL